MTDTYSRMTDITMEELLIDLMSDYRGHLKDDGVKDEILEKFFDNTCFDFTIEGMDDEQLENFESRLTKTYDVVAELELEW